MPLIVVQTWLEELLLVDLARFNNGNMRIALFKNDYTPLITSTLANFTAADFGGYSGPLTLDAWTAAGGGWVSPRYVVVHPAKTWTADGSSTNTIYGYYVYDNTLSALLFAERRATGGVVVGGVAGQTYTVTPQYTRRSEF
jgi:hypothetical protein